MSNPLIKFGSYVQMSCSCKRHAHRNTKNLSEEEIYDIHVLRQRWPTSQKLRRGTLHITKTTLHSDLSRNPQKNAHHLQLIQEEVLGCASTSKFPKSSCIVQTACFCSSVGSSHCVACRQCQICRRSWSSNSESLALVTCRKYSKGCTQQRDIIFSAIVGR